MQLHVITSLSSNMSQTTVTARQEKNQFVYILQQEQSTRVDTHDATVLCHVQKSNTLLTYSLSQC